MATFPAANYLSDAARTEGQMKQAFEDLLAAAKQLPGGTAISSLTIASGSVTPTGPVHRIDTEAAAATDDLANIVTTNLPEGSLLLLTNANAGRVVVVKHNAGGAGLLSLKTAGDFTLADPDKHWLLCMRIGANWTEILRMPEATVPDVITKNDVAYTTTEADRNKLILYTAGTRTLTLLAGAKAGKGFIQWASNTGSGVITIDPNGAETIGGAASLVLNPGDSVGLVWDGTSDWAIIARYVASATDGPGFIVNGVLTATVAGNALTFALKTKAGTDPTAADPVYVSFRSATAEDGSYVVRKITAALSFTFSAGSTGGTQSGVAARVRAYLLDNAGTVEMAGYNSQGTSGLVGLDESALHSTTAEGGAGAADSAHVLYSTTARTDVAIRELGFCEISEATAGTWATAPTKVVTMGPGVHRCGDILQVKPNYSGAVATGATTIPHDDTIPTNTEGDQYFRTAFQASSAMNYVDVDVDLQLSNTTAGQMIIVLQRNDVAVAVKAENYETATNNCSMGLHYCARVDSAVNLNWDVVAGLNNVGTTTLNGASGSRVFGGVCQSGFVMKEIFA